MEIRAATKKDYKELNSQIESDRQNYRKFLNIDAQDLINENEGEINRLVIESGNIVGFIGGVDLKGSEYLRGDMGKGALSIYYNTFPEYARHGYMSEAIDLFITEIFSHYKYEKIFAYVKKGNIASINLLRKLNFKELRPCTNNAGVELRLFLVSKP